MIAPDRRANLTVRVMLRNIVFAAATIGLSLALVPLVLANIHAPIVKATLNAKEITSDGGYAYGYPMSGLTKWPYVALAGRPYRVSGSEIFPAGSTLTEDG